jgi:hypothetical protein
MRMQTVFGPTSTSGSKFRFLQILLYVNFFDILSELRKTISVTGRGGL